MRVNKRFTVRKRRKLEGKTDYRRRMTLLKSKKLRLVIRKTVKHIIAQIVQYETKGDKVVASSHSMQLKKLGWKGSCGSLSAAYLTGVLLGKKAKEAKVIEAILDLGLQSPVKGGCLYACLKGCVDSGLKLDCAEDVFPKEDRVQGKHISAYAAKLKSEDEKKFNDQFAGYIKNQFDPTKFDVHFNEIKKKVM